MNKSPEINNLIWIDLEMTGLDPENDEILEIATIITNNNLEVVAIGPEIAIYQPQEVLDNMNGWCINQHTKSGLVKRVQESKISLEEAEKQTLDFVKSHVAKDTSPMCGNTICQDRRFLYKYMPSLTGYFHYRNLDVSTIKILSSIWAPDLAAQAQKQKKNAHRAKDDILESIEELKFYRDTFISQNL